MFPLIIDLIEQDKIPDMFLHLGIRAICWERLREQRKANSPFEYTFKRKFIHSLQNSEIALVPEKANEQHYEVQADFFLKCLGKRLKYSASFWDETTRTLDEAEEKMLSIYGERMQMYDGASVLELGCGWGSLSLWLAEHFPQSAITGVSNSSSQREFILSRATERNIKNISIITRDMNEFSSEATFDRIISVEMFEHMRNWKQLFGRVSNWLNDSGKFFMHIFTHKVYAYPYLDSGASDWMARYFFSGGMMPSDDLPLHFQDDLVLEDHWLLNGQHYEKTSRAWVQNMDTYKSEILPTLEKIYGAGEGVKWFVRWRLFFMACEELFGYAHGSEWGVSHYRMKKR